jgi:hypothetical protein
MECESSSKLVEKLGVPKARCGIDGTEIILGNKTHISQKSVLEMAIFLSKMIFGFFSIQRFYPSRYCTFSFNFFT